MNTNRNSRARVSSVSAFTLVELLVVIAIMGIVAGMILGLAAASAAGERRKKVISLRDQLVTVLEAYKKEHGFYPPDNKTDCRLPPLFYELRGATYDPNAKTFSGHFPTITTNDYFSVFGSSSIANSRPVSSDPDAEDGKVSDHFVGVRAQQTVSLNINNVDALFLTVGVEMAPGTINQTNTWRYVSTNPTNNGVGNFDLWAEVAIKGKTEIIGNWNK